MLWLKHISGIFGQFTSFFAKKLVLLIILLPLDKKLRRFFCVVIYICIYICIHYRTIEPRYNVFFRKLGQFTCFLQKKFFLLITL